MKIIDYGYVSIVGIWMLNPYPPSDFGEDYFEPLDTTMLPELICPECGGSGRLVGEDYDWECYECNGSGEYTGTLEQVKTAMGNLRRRYYSWQQAWDEPGQSWDVIGEELRAIDTKFWRWAGLLSNLTQKARIILSGYSRST